MRIIFLDIDGVLNCEYAYKQGECKYVEWTDDNGNKQHHQSFCSWSKDWLNRLIEYTDAKIVVSSTWRREGLTWLRKVWEIEGMKGEIIDITPSLRGFVDGYSTPRGVEIDIWLKSRGFQHINWSSEEQKKVMDKSGIESYLIIDDDSDMLYSQRNNFIHVHPSPRNLHGFSRTHYELGLIMLRTDVDKMVYEINKDVEYEK